MSKKFRHTSFTQTEIKEILEKVKFPNGLGNKEMLTIQWWLFFNRRKFNIFVTRINDGMHLNAAFKEAVSSKNKKQ